MQHAIYQLLEKIAVRVVLHLLKVSSTFGTYLVGVLVEEAFDRFIIPLLNNSIIMGHLYYDTAQGKIKIKKLKEARNASEYDSAVDDILQ